MLEASGFSVLNPRGLKNLMSDTNNNKFSLKFLGATVEAMNLKPNSFVKIFWHLAFIVVFLMLSHFAIKVLSLYFGVH